MAAAGDPPKVKKPKKQFGKLPFRAPFVLPKTSAPLPPEEDEELANRVPQHVLRPAPVPQRLRQAADAAGLGFKPELPDHFAHAAHRSGRPGAVPMMRKTAKTLTERDHVRFGSGDYDPEEEEEVEDEEERKKKLVHKPWTDSQLRQAFSTFDLDQNDFVDAAELRHIFAQIGEMPSDNEISAMIMLCDPRGDGTVNFDDFLTVFSQPAESLRNVNVKGLKHLLPRKKVDFDIRDPLGIVLEEKTRLKERWLVVSEVRRGSQAQDEGVKNGWKVVTLEGEKVVTEKDFSSRLKKLEKAAAPDDDEPDFVASLTSKGKAKAKAEALSEEEKKKRRQQIKYDYSIVFEVLPGIDDTSSSEEDDLLEDEELEEEGDDAALEDDEEDDQ